MVGRERKINKKRNEGCEEGRTIMKKKKTKSKVKREVRKFGKKRRAKGKKKKYGSNTHPIIFFLFP